MTYEIPDWAKSIPDASEIKRFRSYDKATKADLTPVEFSPENQYAEFSGKHGYYCTTLHSCTSEGKPCGGGYPCKHMYRLAMMLGIMPGKYENDSSKIKWMRSGISLELAVQRIETLSDDSQDFLLSCILDLRHKPKASSDIPANLASELESKKVLTHVDEPDQYILHPDLDKASYGLYRYLCRKLNWRSYFHENLGPVLVPDGSKPGFEFDTPVNGSPDAFYFPDDPITALLTAHGCNHCLNGYIPQKDEE